RGGGRAGGVGAGKAPVEEDSQLAFLRGSGGRAGLPGRGNERVIKLESTIEQIAASVVLLGLWMVGLTHLRSKLTIYGLQTVTLGGLAVWVGIHHKEPALVVAGTAIALLKGIAVPAYLGRVIRKIGCRRDEGL